jgi:rhamnosyltransferase
MKPSLPVAPRVCAVIITYNPHPAFLGNIAAAGAQVGHVVVVDNGSSGETEEHLHALEARQDCTVIRNRQNLGIAAALNLGVKYAMEAGFDWVATFDQDSRISEGFISQMLDTYRQASHPEKVALIAPTYVDRESGIQQPIMRARNGENLVTMTSGNMLPSSAIQNLGAFDESLYMDYVDIEFCLRARRQGMRILQSPAVLFHSCGRLTHHRLFGRRFGASNHSAARRYYITRNRVRLMMPYAADWSWLWREIKMMLSEATKIVLVEDDKWKKFRAMAAGIADALSGKIGKQIEL